MAPVIVFMKTRRPHCGPAGGGVVNVSRLGPAGPVMTIMQWFNDVGVSSGTSRSDILQDIEDDKIQ